MARPECPYHLLSGVLRVTLPDLIYADSHRAPGTATSYALEGRISLSSLQSKFGGGPQELIAQSGDALGAVPEVSPPWTVTTIGEYMFRLRPGLELTFRAQDAFASRNPGPFRSDHRYAITYAPGRRADPSVNRLDLSARVSDDHFDVSVFVNNALNSKPTWQLRNRFTYDKLFYATTLRPRTVGLTATWRFGQRR